jgi:predicted SAM-dependent methyltransferase
MWPAPSALRAVALTMEKTQPYPYLPQLQSDTMQAYLDELEHEGTKGLERGQAVALLRKVSSPRLRDWVKLNGPIVLTPLVRRKARTLVEHGGAVRLNLGSGPRKVPGWINVDILGMGADLSWDLRRGIPFPDGSARSVFLEHVLEHFSFADGLELLSSCRDVLQPGGVIRVGVPDFGRYMESYAADRAFIEELRPRRPTPLLALAEVALHHGHRSIWDGQTLERALTDSGFEHAAVRAFGESALEPAPDDPDRRPETVYAEAVKPGGTA